MRNPFRERCYASGCRKFCLKVDGGTEAHCARHFVKILRKELKETSLSQRALREELYDYQREVRTLREQLEEARSNQEDDSSTSGTLTTNQVIDTGLALEEIEYLRGKFIYDVQVRYAPTDYDLDVTSMAYFSNISSVIAYCENPANQDNMCDHEDWFFTVFAEPLDDPENSCSFVATRYQGVWYNDFRPDLLNKETNEALH